jgi:hypothetical protein
LNDILQAEHDHTNLNLYLTLFTSLKEISYKSTQNIYNIVGVKISNKKNKIIPEVEKKPAKELSLRVTHEAERYTQPNPAPPSRCRSTARPTCNCLSPTTTAKSTYPSPHPDRSR